MSSDCELRIGIIGPGGMGDVHARVLRDLGAFLVAVAGPNVAELAAFGRSHDVDVLYQDVDALVGRDDVDAVVVASPSELHVEHALRSIEAGKHVLCEIPAGTSLAAARQLVDAAGASPVSVQVGHTLRHWAPYLELRERLGSRPDVTQVILRSCMLRQSDAGWTGRARDWTDSLVWHHGAHAVDMALLLLGEPPEVTVRGLVAAPWAGSGTPMDAACVVGTPDGRLGTVALSYHARIPTADCLVIGAGATYEVRGATLFGAGGVLRDFGDVAEVQLDAVRRQDRAFIDAVVNDAPTSPSPIDVLPAMAVLERLGASGHMA